MNELDKFMHRLKTHERHSKKQARDALFAERFIKRLRPGYNYFTPDQFLVMVDYLYPYPETEKIRAAALRSGRHKMGAIELMRVPWMNEDRLVSLTDLSRELGIERTGLVKAVHRLNIPSQVRGKKVMYDIDRLRECLDLNSGT